MSETDKKTDFLRFNAYSIKELITRKLSQDSRFTDQIYEGSNLATLIDLVSYMYQCLTYQLNSAASESMFSDVQVYENINRLVSMIGYNPKGCIPSNCQFTFENTISKSNGVIVNNYYGKCIMPYSAIDTGLVDSRGNKIYYSTVEPYYINNNEQFSIVAYNGVWKMYNEVFVASGEAYDTFLINGLKSIADENRYIMWPYIDVYVRHYNSQTGEFQYRKWKYVEEGLFTDNDVTNGTKLYSSTDPIYNIRLIEDKTYEIKFGNGINGMIPENGDEIVIFYLEGNGDDAKIEGLNTLTELKMQHSPAFFEIASTLYLKIFADYISNSMEQSELDQITWSNTSQSTEFTEEETVEQIRTNAPNWFKRGNRLITENDYVQYFKERYADNIIDVTVMNNWEYISTFYRWLYNLGQQKRDNPKYYLNQNNLIKYDYKYADACDSNNVYIWAKMKNDIDIYGKTFKKEISNIKTLTSDPVFVKPIDVNFMISAKEIDDIKALIKGGNAIEDTDSFLEILLNNSTLYTNDVIAQRINNVIVDFFKSDNFKMGTNVDYNHLLNNIYEIDGVERIRTVCEYTNDDGELKYKIVNGISFATWSSTIIRDGDDLEISNTTRVMEPFQFPVLYELSVLDKIKVIKRNTAMINSVYY